VRFTGKERWNNEELLALVKTKGIRINVTDMVSEAYEPRPLKVNTAWQMKACLSD